MTRRQQKWEHPDGRSGRICACSSHAYLPSSSLSQASSASACALVLCACHKQDMASCRLAETSKAPSASSPATHCSWGLPDNGALKHAVSRQLACLWQTHTLQPVPSARCFAVLLCSCASCACLHAAPHRPQGSCSTLSRACRAGVLRAAPGTLVPSAAMTAGAHCRPGSICPRSSWQKVTKLLSAQMMSAIT